MDSFLKVIKREREMGKHMKNVFTNVSRDILKFIYISRYIVVNSFELDYPLKVGLKIHSLKKKKIEKKTKRNRRSYRSDIGRQKRDKDKENKDFASQYYK